MKKIYFSLALMGWLPAIGQDTTHAVPGVVVVGYPGAPTLLKATGAAVVADSSLMASFSGSAAVPVFNTIPGVRMEERSPGSYRLSIRGSLLRSPFGVRNVKVYLNELPFTDAGGNTYLNAIPLSGMGSIELLRGPDGSIFGANSGGALLLDGAGTSTAKLREISLTTGSFGLLNEQVSWKQKLGNHQLQVRQSYQQLAGYRKNSGQRQLYFYADDDWQYRKNARLRVTALYSDLEYQTPGGLTYDQYLEYPSAARFPTAQTPGAKTQKAAVYSNIAFGGLTHSIELGRHWKQVISASGSLVDFENPFITNYEQRKEKSLALRSWLEYGREDMEKDIHWNYRLGLEWQRTDAQIDNYDNIAGAKGMLQASDHILSNQHFFFNQLRFSWREKLHAEASLSLNYTKYNINRDALSTDFRPQWMPRFGLTYLPLPQFAFRATVSKGYSSPTTAELRPSDNNIYNGLQPELGWNYEAGFRLQTAKQRLWFDLAAYHYRLEQAIVRRQNADATEYFVNAGGVRQSGIEAQLRWAVISARETGLLRSWTIYNNYTYMASFFHDYVIDGANYSGNAVTGIPRHVVVTGTRLEWSKGIAFFAQHNFTEQIPLNDANAVYAAAYHLVQLKLDWTFPLSKATTLNLFAGCDNLLNQKYSLGNDLNAAGGRYFNTAPPRNYFGGIKFRF